MFRPNMDEVTRGWEIYHNEALHKLYSLPDIITATTSRKRRLVEHAARIER
jgi:hypothetical protein